MSSVRPKDPPTTEEWEVLVDIQGPAAPPEEESAPDRPANETNPLAEAEPSGAGTGEDLKRAKSDASTKLEGLEGRLTEMESRVGEADRLRAEAEARADRAEREVEEAKARLEEAQSREQAQSGAMPGDRQPDERASATAAEAGLVSLSTATFDDLRGLGMSVTQVKRVLAYRERLDGFDSVDDLDHVPGLPTSFLTEMKHKLTL
jgi:DNA uptake protein ComE-like DNA-binding protein